MESNSLTDFVIEHDYLIEMNDVVDHPMEVNTEYPGQIIPLPCSAVILMGYVRDAIDNMSKSLAMRMRTATATKLNVKQGMGHGERFRVDSHRKEGHGVQEHRHGDDKQGHGNHEWCSKNF